MSGWDPVLLVMLACLAVILIGPTEYVSLAGFGLMGVIVVVLLAGRMDIIIPTFALAGAGAVLLGVRTIGMLAGVWDQDNDQVHVEHHTPPNQQGTDDTTEADHIWR